MPSPRMLVIMGSGETAPSMVSTHQLVTDAAAEAAGDRPVTVRVVDTPYGFQENAAEISARAVAYLRRRIDAEVAAVTLGDHRDLGPAAYETALRELERADVVFAGPGSPTYLLRQWRDRPVADLLRRRLVAGGPLVFASAAACTLGTQSIPVYEIYKVGSDPHWVPGLDLLRTVGLDAVVVPHYDNAEGGTHDTRYCYLGERRLRRMEAALPEGTWILGVDEHTACVLDLEEDSVTVTGRGAVTARHAGHETRIEAGATVATSELVDAAAAAPRGGRPAAAFDADRAGDGGTGGEDDLPSRTAALDRRFADAMDSGDLTAAVDAALLLEEAVDAWREDLGDPVAHERARGRLRAMIGAIGELADAGLHDHRDVVAPYVDALLDLREAARDAREFETADHIRALLTVGGVEVRDTPAGTEWEYGAD